MTHKRSFILAAALMACLFPLWGIGGLHAQDTIRLTWQSEPEAYMYTRSFGLVTSNGGEFIIDWGDGSPVDTKTGFALHTYNNFNYKDTSYTVTVAATTPDCRFTGFSCFERKVTFLDVRKCPKIGNLACYDNQLTALNLNGCIELSYLDCSNNQLSVLDVGTCTALQRLDCYNNSLSILDISNNTVLEKLFCFENKLTDLDLGKNTKLEQLTCSNNQLNTLDINKNIALIELICYNNRLQLSDLYNASQKINASNNKWLGTQRLYPREVIVGDTVNFSAQRTFGGKATVFTIEKDSLPTSDYTINNGIITFKDTGIYTITMTNAAIVSYSRFPAEVIVDIHVLPDVGIADVTNYEIQITSYEVYDILGRKHVTRHCGLDPQSTTNNTWQEIAEQVRNDVPIGIYILKLNTNKGVIVNKLIINK